MSNPYFTVEDARFQLILIHLGIIDRFQPWLETLMEAEDPLSSAVLELAWCPADMNSIVHILEKYTHNAQIDDSQVVKMLRNDLLQRMAEGEMDMDGCMKILSKASILPYANAKEPWISIDNLYSLYKLSLEPFGLNPASFKQYFFSFMHKGTPISYDTNDRNRRKKICNFLHKYFKGKSKT